MFLKSLVKTDMKEYICQWCGDKFMRWQCYEKRKNRNKFCSVTCSNKARCGENSPRWKGGRFETNGGSGYSFVYLPDHPKANSTGFVLEHRAVMEKVIGRYLLSNEMVHHKNGRKSDNRIENLEIVLRNAHRGEVQCPHCQKKFSIT